MWKISQQQHPGTTHYGQWYIYNMSSDNYPAYLYLHQDLVPRQSTICMGKYTGYYESEESAKDTLDKYLAKLELL